MTGCEWGKRVENIVSRLGLSPPPGLVTGICGLDGSVAYSIVELLDLVHRYLGAATDKARAELGSSIESSLVELYRVTRGAYGKGLPRSLHEAVNRLIRGGSEEVLAELLGALGELVESLAQRGRKTG